MHPISVTQIITANISPHPRQPLEVLGLGTASKSFSHLRFHPLEIAGYMIEFIEHQTKSLLSVRGRFAYESFEDLTTLLAKRVTN